MPIKDKDDGPVVEFLQTGEVAADKKAFQHRRKIIKASAAVVPAIMTIRSGAAVAMTSINQCEERDAARAALLPESQYAVGDPDEWVRMEAMSVVIGNNPSITLYSVPDNGVVTRTLADYTVWYDETGSTKENKGSYKEYVEIVKQKDIDDTGKVVFLLCYVDAASGVYSWYPQKPVATLDVGASAITGSCLCSVNPDFKLG